MDAHPSYQTNISLIISQYHPSSRKGHTQNNAFILQLYYKQQLKYKHVKFALQIKGIL